MLLKKYNIPGPRYTSYPTVPYWENTPSEQTWINLLNQSFDDAEKSNQGLALYLHIPFCESLCTYCGCNTRITRKHSVAKPYLDTILEEWNLYEKKLGRNQYLLSELHLGGGTPTFLSPDELRYLFDSLLVKFKLAPSYEFSIEVDPRVTSKEQLKVLAEYGFKRVSMGIQDFDPKVQKIVNREQSFEEVKELTDASRELGYTSVNYDLIYGLPFQTQKSIKDTFEKINLLRPDRIAYYSYAHVPWIKPSQRKFTENDLPQADEKRALYELGRLFLENNGYKEIGMDHFALETDSLWKAYQSKSLHRNFMGYISRKVSPLIGLGVSSISDSWTAFSQNEKHLESYVRQVKDGQIPILRGHVLTEEDLILREHILNLMTQFHTNWDNDLKSSARNTLGSATERLSELSRDGLVQLKQNECKITEKGRPYIRNVCMAFDSRLIQKAPQTKLFSQTI